MEFMLNILIQPSKFYQRMQTDNYHNFNENEKNELKSFLNSDTFKNRLKTYLNANDIYHSEMKIESINQKEINASLYLDVDVKTDNIDNYTAKKIDKILDDSFMYYYRSESINYGKTIFYSYDENYGDGVLVDKCKKNELYDYDSEDSEDETEKDEYKKIYVYPVVEARIDLHSSDKVYPNMINNSITERYVLNNKNSMFMIIEKINFKDEEYWNTKGTDVTNFERNCADHDCVYYSYVYDSKSKNNLLYSECHQEKNLDDVIIDVRGFINAHGIYRSNARYWYITDKRHNVLYEFPVENKNPIALWMYYSFIFFLWVYFVQM